MQEQIESFQEQRGLVRSKRTICCPACKRHTAVEKATIISDHYYVPPRGCVDGAYWTFSEYRFYCAKCNSFHRAYTGSFDKDYMTEEFTSEALTKFRLQLYLFIKKHFDYFGERLRDYDKGGTITELRERQKEDA